jgi:hypothetical protein
MGLINNYLDIGRIRPRLELIDDNYDDIRPRITLAGELSSALFSALAIQLMVAVSGTKTSAICSECRETYFPERRPKTGQANYCRKESCQKASRREASRMWRTKLHNTKTKKRKKLTEVKNGKARAK